MHSVAFLYVIEWSGTMVSCVQVKPFFPLNYRVVWNLGFLYYRVEPYVAMYPCGLLLFVTYFGSELYARIRIGRDVGWS